MASPQAQSAENRVSSRAGSNDVTTSATAKGDPSSRVYPKEHGAYAILAIPMVTAVVITGPTVVGFCVAVASITGFLAHEPMLIALGHRGRRAQTSTPTARLRLLAYLGITFFAGTTAMAIGSTEVRLSLIACLAMAVVSFSLAAMGKHRTRYGQLWGVVGLSAPCVPMLLAGNVNAGQALSIWVTWLLGFTATTFVVHSVIAAQKRTPRGVYAAILVTVSLVVAVDIALRVNGFAAILPMLAVSWFLYFRPPPARHLRRVGWTLVAATIAAALLIIIRVTNTT